MFNGLPQNPEGLIYKIVKVIYYTPLKRKTHWHSMSIFNHFTAVQSHESVGTSFK